MHGVAIVSGVIGSLALAALAVASEPAAWSPAPFEQSRLADRPVLLVVADPSCAPCQAAATAVHADQGVADRVARDFVVVHADAIARPDLADEFGLAVRELGGGSGFPLLVALTPDTHPYLGRGGLDAFEPAAFDRFATEAVSGFRTARSGLDARAAAVLDTLR
ncbi:MAG TPA: DUF255 domain-containing protein, partial [Vicinamibacteria bacterium]|nr:DUF255 domain-containing protein [Vicinamibacteria bacterium]